MYVVTCHAGFYETDSLSDAEQFMDWAENQGITDLKLEILWSY